MDLFGLNRFMQGPEDDPGKKGAGRYFQALWGNLGGLLGGNLLTFAGFLPLALGVSLGIVYENLWLTLLAGGVGGAAAGLFWVPMLSLSLQAFRGGTAGWFCRWRQAFLRAPAAAAATGGAVGLMGSGLLFVCALFLGLGTEGLAVPLVSVILALDLFILALASTLAFPIFCAGERGKTDWGQALRTLLFSSPGRLFGAVLGTLVWCALGAALFPVSVPFAAVLGFWPPALLTAQLLLPGLEGCFDLTACGWEAPDDPAPPAKSGLTARERSEIWWRRRGPVVVIIALLVTLFSWGSTQLFSFREPDLQIAFVHGDALPDGVRAALEDALAARVGDRNGDGQARVQVNDYTVVFDGAPADSDRQTAGSALLVSDLAVGDSALFVVEDPDGFLERYGDQVDAGHAALWADCPGLAGLDAGSWYTPEDVNTDLPGQSLLGGLTVLPSRAAPDGMLEILLF